MTSWVSRYHKGKTSLDLNEAGGDGVWGCSGISWTICKQSASRSRQVTTPASHHSVCTGRMLFLTPNQQCQSKHWRHTNLSSLLLIICKHPWIWSAVFLTLKSEHCYSIMIFLHVLCSSFSAINQHVALLWTPNARNQWTVKFIGQSIMFAVPIRMQ